MFINATGQAETSQVIQNKKRKANHKNTNVDIAETTQR
jgi:hypothetical protein